MIRVVLELLLAGSLGVAGVLKLARLDATAAALPRGGRPAAIALAGLELALTVGVASGLRAGAFAAAGVLAVFALYLALALATGHGGAPCPCFGARSRITPLAAVRTALLAGAALAVALLPAHHLSTDAWLGLGLGVALLGIAALSLAVAALARELGRLRLELRPQAALEVLEEGPELGARPPALAGRFAPGPRTRLSLAVFTSESCALCHALAPAVATLARDPLVAVETFDEGREPELWHALGIPGSPYAVALDLDGTVRAKGTWNTPAQLEGMLATAERRHKDTVLA